MKMESKDENIPQVQQQPPVEPKKVGSYNASASKLEKQWPRIPDEGSKNILRSILNDIPNYKNRISPLQKQKKMEHRFSQSSLHSSVVEQI